MGLTEWDPANDECPVCQQKVNSEPRIEHHPSRRKTRYLKLITLHLFHPKTAIYSHRNCYILNMRSPSLPEGLQLASFYKALNSF